jgi:hypothetical protein
MGIFLPAVCGLDSRLFWLVIAPLFSFFVNPVISVH